MNPAMFTAPYVAMSLMPAPLSDQVESIRYKEDGVLTLQVQFMQRLVT